MRYIEKEDDKIEVIREILTSLTDWFGIPEAIEDYLKGSARLPVFVIYECNEPIGVIAMQQHFDNSAEIYVMGVKQQYHRSGVGKQLVEQGVTWCLEREIHFLQVKTLSAQHPDLNYAKTRRFYETMGFHAIEVYPDLWDKSNPCLQMMKYIK